MQNGISKLNGVPSETFVEILMDYLGDFSIEDSENYSIRNKKTRQQKGFDRKKEKAQLIDQKIRRLRRINKNQRDESKITVLKSEAIKLHGQLPSKFQSKHIIITEKGKKKYLMQ